MWATGSYGGEREKRSRFMEVSGLVDGGGSWRFWGVGMVEREGERGGRGFIWLWRRRRGAVG